MTPAKTASFVLFAALGVVVVRYHLGPALLAGLFSYMVLDLTHRPIQKRIPRLLASWVSVMILLVIAVAISWMLLYLIKRAMEHAPVILTSLIPQIDSMAATYGINLPFENLQEFKLVILETLKENAQSITKASGLLTKGFFQIIVGIFVAILYFLSEHPMEYPSNLFDQTRKEFNERVKIFMVGFEKILGAQVLISLINTLATAVFLYSIGMPYKLFLVLSTFILGIFPLVGNLASNTIIVGTALTLSPKLAVAALAFLVTIHKLEYFLNSKIMGSAIDVPMWQMLLGLLIGESLIGLPGIILAPPLLHYIREDLRSLPAKEPV